MLTIICGEDIVKSREYYHQMHESMKKKGYEIRELKISGIDELKKWMSHAPSLFAEQVVYFTENLVKHLKSKRSKTEYADIDALAKQPGITWYDWEKDVMAREITGLKSATITEFKPAETIFKLLEICSPGNKKLFIDTLELLAETNDELFIYTMLHRHVRSMLLIKSDQTPPGMQPWQKARIGGQTASWTLPKLVTFYEGLARIDVNMKTSRNVYGVKESIEVLAARIL